MVGRTLLASMLALAACGQDLVVAQLAPGGPDVADASPADDGGGSQTDARAPETGAPACDGGTACRRIVFVTSLVFGGVELGGASGADAKCQSAADSAPPGGPVRGKRFHAWLSSSGISAADRLSHGNAYVRADPEKTAVVADFAALLAPLPALESAISVDESGVDLALSAVTGDLLVWTGTTAGGGASTSDCGAWSANVALDAKGAVGNGMSTRSSWTDYGLRTCAVPAHLYCFED